MPPIYSFITTDGRNIPVEKVRIEETFKTRESGHGIRTRYAKLDRNHHLEIFGLTGSGGADKKWEAPGAVTMPGAYRGVRQKNSQPFVQRLAEPGWEFRFSLAQGERTAFAGGLLKGCYLVVGTISEGEKSGSVKI